MPDFGAEPRGRSPTDRLGQFLKGTSEVLDSLVRKGKDPLGRSIFVPELLKPMQDAWSELGPAFSVATKAVTKVSAERLIEHGLDGKQLDFKLRVVDWISGQFHRLGGAKLLNRLLDAIENLLDSIIDVSGAGGAIREFKEGMKSSVQEE